MLSIIIAFLTGVVFAGAIGARWIRMLSKSKVPESCHEKCKIIIDAKNEIKEVREDRDNKLSSILNKVNEL